MRMKKMTRTYCDICKKEQTVTKYVVPIYSPANFYAVKENQVQKPFVFTYERLNDTEIEICDCCKRKVAAAIKQLIEMEKIDTNFAFDQEGIAP